MNLKKFMKSILVAFCISLSLPAFSNPVNPGVELAAIAAGNPVKTADPLARLMEIKSMDLKSLSRAEKKELRKEVKGIRKELKAEHKTGIYLSFGAIVIIILLLILLL